ncbi:hypothetical protein B0H14DRAFT_2357720, partial [Mycena olivaceomarginata]
SNPLDSTSHETTPPPRTQTVPARDVFRNVQAAMRPLIAGIQTQEQRNMNETRRDQIMDPPAISYNGRPPTARITNAREDRQRGGGASSSRNIQPETYKCSLCHQEGHNRTNCPLQL